MTLVTHALCQLLYIHALVPSATAAAGTEESELAPGLIVERVHAAIEPPVPFGDRLITLVRIDPKRYRFELLTAAVHGTRSAPQWVKDFKLAGAINASMFRPDSRSTGLMLDGEVVNNRRDNPAFGAFFAFHARKDNAPDVQMFGRQCDGFDLARIKDSYLTIVQNYRMLGCSGRAILWQDEKAYSLAAVGMDDKGWVVFIHSRTPYRVRDFNTMLASPKLGLRAAMFVEGGPEASLFVKAGETEVRAIGSYETGFNPDDSNERFWHVPNVIGFVARGATASGGSPNRKRP